MRKLPVFAVAALALVACKKEQPASLAPPPQAAAAPEGVVAATEPVAQAFVATGPKLASFVKYQQKMLEVHAQALTDLKTMDGKGDAGDYGGVAGGLAAANDAVGFIKRREAAQVVARKESGLTEQEVEQYESLVGDVIMKRLVGRTVNLESTLKRMEQMRSSLPKDQQAGLDQSLSELKKQQEEMKMLAEEREKYGSANVDLVLTQEAELTANHQKMMGLWGAKP